MTTLREGVSCDYRRWCCSLTETDAPGLPISGHFELARPNGRSWRDSDLPEDTHEFRLSGQRRRDTLAAFFSGQRRSDVGEMTWSDRFHFPIWRCRSSTSAQGSMNSFGVRNGAKMIAMDQAGSSEVAALTEAGFLTIS
jgi:hypothetical protein